MNGIPLRKVAVACALALSGTAPANAQVGKVEPGLYGETIKSETYLEKGGKTIDLPEGKAGFAGQEELKTLDEVPTFFTFDRTPAPGAAGDVVDCGVFEGRSPALSDQPLQSDFERYDRYILGEIDRYLSEGYPPASVLLHAASMGISLDRAMYAAVRSQPLRTNELYLTALQMMAFLPGWSCSAGADRGLYNTVYDVNDLPDQRLVRDVADRYFRKDRARLADFPDWPHDEFNMLASPEELLSILSETETQHWYRPGPSQSGPGANPRDTVLIGLYPDKDQIVIDKTEEQIRRWRDEGKGRMPVVFFFNFDYQFPISRLGADVKLENVIDAFFGSGEELTPVPLHTVGDNHMMVAGDELEALFDIPPSDEIDPQRYQSLVDELNTDGFSKKPVMVSLLDSGGYRRLAEPDRVRVALDQGVEQFPTAVFYHRLDREPCGAPATCLDQLCDALVCAGGQPSSCVEQTEAIRTGFQPPGGGGGSPPPPPLPPPPASPG